MFTPRVCQTALILVSIFAIGLSIKCFQCNSAEHPECKDLTVNDTSSPFYQECSEDHGSQQQFCRKISQEVLDEEGSIRIIRTCGWVLSNKNGDYCRKSNTDFLNRINCQCFSDACNSSERIASSTKLTIILNSVFSILLYFMCRY